jgi:hypothetical protein
LALNQTNTYATYDDFLGDVVRHVTDQYLNGQGTKPGHLFNVPMAWVKRPIGTVYADAVVGEITNKTRMRAQQDTHEVVQFTRQEIEKEQQTTIAAILNRPAEDTVDEHRLMQWQRVRGAVPTVHATNDHLVLQLEAEHLPNGAMPYVFGYELIGYDPQAKAYVFAYDKANDPYLGEPLPITGHQASQLADIYEQRGLAGLARDIRRTRNLTTRKAADLLSKHTDYAQPDWHTYTHTNSLDALDDCVEDGRYVMQCSGSARVTELSQRPVLPPGATIHTELGFTIKRGEHRITNPGHAQNMVSYNGKQHMLDATATSELGGRPVRSHRRMGAWLIRKGSQGDTAQLAEITHEAVPTAMPTPEPLPETPPHENASVTIAATLRTLERQLMTMLNQPRTDDLYQHAQTRMRQLPHDPLTHVLHAAKRAELGLLEQADIDRTRMYLDAQRKQRANGERPTGSQLSDSLLNMLAHTLSTVEHNYKQTM